MDLSLQKKLAASVLGCSRKRVLLDPSKLDDIKEAITKEDIRSLIRNNVITRKPVRGVSKFRSRKRHQQRVRGRQKGHGKRRGTPNARMSLKERWINRVRLQRNFLKELKDKEILSVQNFRLLYLKSKGGFFRSKRHIKLYIDENKLATKPIEKATRTEKKKSKQEAKQE